MNIYQKISPKIEENAHERIKAIILFDPAEIYSRITFDKYKRRQSFSMGVLFPTKQKGICACGCGEKLIGKQTRWRSEDCHRVPLGILQILNGDLAYIGSLMQWYLPHRCAKCNCENYLLEKKQYSEWHKREIVSYSSSGLQVDHILGIQNGGSGAWLGNYQFLCHRCHSIKTKADNALKRANMKLAEQQSLFPARILSLA